MFFEVEKNNQISHDMWIYFRLYQGKFQGRPIMGPPYGKLSHIFRDSYPIDFIFVLHFGRHKVQTRRKTTAAAVARALHLPYLSGGFLVKTMFPVES